MFNQNLYNIIIQNGLTNEMKAQLQGSLKYLQWLHKAHVGDNESRRKSHQASETKLKAASKRKFNDTALNNDSFSPDKKR